MSSWAVLTGCPETLTGRREFTESGTLPWSIPLRLPTRPNRQNGRHENGQNYLVNTGTVERLLACVPDDHSPVVEIGPGQGALTFPLQDRLLPEGRSLTTVEIDPETVQWLEKRLDPSVRLFEQDFLDHKLPEKPHVVVGNLPVHLTTAMLRHILHSPAWTHAVLLVQWEVARRRAGVGVATMMTVQWWPWIQFDLHGRVPATHFAPRPTVDGGVLSMQRRESPLLDWDSRRRYTSFVHAVFTGKGRGIAAILRRVGRGDEGGSGDRGGGRRGRGRDGVDGAVDVAMRGPGCLAQRCRRTLRRISGSPCSTASGNR